MACPWARGPRAEVLPSVKGRLGLAYLPGPFQDGTRRLFFRKAVCEPSERLSRTSSRTCPPALDAPPPSQAAPRRTVVGVQCPLAAPRRPRSRTAGARRR